MTSIKTTPESIGLRIKALREKNKETQTELAEAIHCNQNNISKMESGGSLTAENLIAVAEHFNVSLDYLCKGEGGIDLLDTLNKYIRYEIINTTSTNYNKTINNPRININAFFYHYLRQTALADNTSEMPIEIRKQWSRHAKDEFNKKITNDNYDDYISFYIIEESLLKDNPEIVCQIENIISK
ncbi:MAG: helix-turn-helix transcriptional regulator [Ruminococcus sp.]|nr:helix-turn-helix transcriptional regulator [Ruminococcus sp.]MBR7008026.1 helix-turn-helix transcriptional regulator [Ruminococcus sp.]